MERVPLAVDLRSNVIVLIFYSAPSRNPSVRNWVEAHNEARQFFIAQ